MPTDVTVQMLQEPVPDLDELAETAGEIALRAAKYTSPLAQERVLIAAAALLGLALTACAASKPAPDLATATHPLAASTPVPAGRIPDALPAELSVGMQDTEAGAAWMKASGVPWRFRYRYLVMDGSGGWATNWNATSPRDGRFAARYLADSAGAGVTGAFSYYSLLGMPGGGEDAAYAKIKNATTMKAYFSDWRLLMTVAKAFGGTVLVQIEPDSAAQIQIQSGQNAQAPAAVASTGLPELAGLPNTVAGWLGAFAAIRNAVGATNVLIGHHASVWSTGVDVLRGSGLTADLATNAAKTAAFLSSAGPGAQDVVFVEQADRDCAYRNNCWATADDAGLNTASFRRDTEWYRLINQGTQKRLVAWQLPWGGELQRNVADNGTPGSGWKSNHLPWWFGPGSAAHREAMGSAGVIALLFGAGATGMSTHKTSVQADGGLWSLGDVAAYLKPSSVTTCVPQQPVCTTPPPVCSTTTVDAGLELPR